MILLILLLDVVNLWIIIIVHYIARLSELRRVELLLRYHGILTVLHHIVYRAWSLIIEAYSLLHFLLLKTLLAARCLLSANFLFHLF